MNVQVTPTGVGLEAPSPPGTQIRLITGSHVLFPTGEAVGGFLLEGWYEAQEQAFVYQYLSPGGVFIDVGAHAGLYSMIAASRVGSQGRVIAVEPNTHILPYLETNMRVQAEPAPTASGGSRFIVAAALSDRAGESAFNNRDVQSSAYAALAVNSDPTMDRVATFTLDSLVDTAQLKRVDLVKVDVEGAEHLVLSGARDTLAKFPDIAFLMEFTETNRERFGHSTEMLLAFVRSLGLQAGRLDMTKGLVEAVQGEQPLWHNNLVLARDLAAINWRLTNARKHVRLVAADFARKGEAVRARYEESEALRNATSAMQGPAQRLARLRGALGADGGAPSERLADAMREAPLAQRGQRLADWLTDELARVEGDVLHVVGELGLAREGRRDAVYASLEQLRCLAQLMGRARGQLTGANVEDEIAGRLRSTLEKAEMGEMLPRIVTLLLDEAGKVEGAAIAHSQIVGELREQRRAIEEAFADLLRSTSDGVAEVRAEIVSVHDLLSTVRKASQPSRALAADAPPAVDGARQGNLAWAGAETAADRTHLLPAGAMALAQAMATTRAALGALRAEARASLAEIHRINEIASSAVIEAEAAREDALSSRLETQSVQMELDAVKLENGKLLEEAKAATYRVQSLQVALDAAMAQNHALVEEAGAALAEQQTLRAAALAARRDLHTIGECLFELRRSRILRLSNMLRLRSGALVEKMVRVYSAEDVARVC